MVLNVYYTENKEIAPWLNVRAVLPEDHSLVPSTQVGQITISTDVHP